MLEVPKKVVHVTSNDGESSIDAEQADKVPLKFWRPGRYRSRVISYNVRAVKKPVCIAILVLSTLLYAPAGTSQMVPGTYENSLVIAPLYVDYTLKTAQKFASDATDLKTRLGGAPYVMLGFSAYLDGRYPSIPLDQPLTESGMAPTLEAASLIVNRARDNGIITHISIVSGFFHGTNNLRRRAIRDDVRNAQWFSDGWIAPPTSINPNNTNNSPVTSWVTPSRYARPLRARVEEGTRIMGQHLAGLMAQFPETLVSISGDGETEFTYERNFTDSGDTSNSLPGVVLTDYSPFMVEEFRDWLRNDRYSGDLAPDTDDNGDGRTFNRDFQQSFTTWSLRYYDNSGPISYPDYVRLPEKLPTSGQYFIPGGFDAPRSEAPGDPLWSAWLNFRKEVISNWNKDFATWITTSPDPNTGFTIPASRYYSHQIPADLIFGRTNDKRLLTSGSYIESAILEPLGSTGVTAFNGWDGKRHVKTATPQLYSELFMTSDHWGIMEYNPSMPYNNLIAPSSDLRYYMNELRILYNFRPHVIVPFAWSDLSLHKRFTIQNTVFEKALRQFIQEIGRTPWYSWRATLR